MSARLTPMLDDFCGIYLRHGERGDADPAHPEACFCGEPIYYLCDGWLDDEDGFHSLVISLAPNPEGEASRDLRDACEPLKAPEPRGKT